MSSWVPAQSRELLQAVLPAHNTDTAVTRLYNASAEVTVVDVANFLSYNIHTNSYSCIIYSIEMMRCQGFILISPEVLRSSARLDLRIVRSAILL